MERNNLIPAPSSFKKMKGSFLLTSETTLSLKNKSPEVRKVAQLFASELEKDTGLLPFIKEEATNGGIAFELTEQGDAKSSKAFSLTIGPEGVTIGASAPEGLFRATRRLRQLVLLEKTKSGGSGEARQLPALVIKDTPRFQWRGLNLDCSRHFMNIEFIKRRIDLLALYGMNIFHWHLIDDQGWRLEIKKYPHLTEVGAWRRGRGGKKYGGFYTQKQVKEVVAYGAERYITVVPEIEMPGHCRSALAAYPELSCNGKSFEVEGKWGIMKDVYCPGSDETIAFLEDVLEEVLELFPSEYIHVGGDECLKARWKECSLCRERIRAEGLADEEELQSWFIAHFANWLQRRKRKIIGWDEIREGGIPGDAVVQSWRGSEGAVEAARQGHHTIVSPTTHTYFDYGLARINLEKVYSFEPVPGDLSDKEAELVLGTEANMWTEYAPQKRVDTMLFPRLLALAEVAWTPQEKKNWHDFHARVQKHYLILENSGVNYGKERESFLYMIKYFSRDVVAFFRILKDDPSTAWMHLKMYFGVKS